MRADRTSVDVGRDPASYYAMVLTHGEGWRCFHGHPSREEALACAKANRDEGVLMTTRPRKTLVAAMLLLGSVLTAHAQRTPTLRPNPADLSYAVYVANSTDPLKWFHGHTATQVERSAVADGLAGIAIPRVIQFMRTMPGCLDDLTFAFSQLSDYTMKLDEVYEAGRMRQGDWTIKAPWPYSIPWYIERRAQSCVTDSRSAMLCAAAIPPPMELYLDVRVQNGKCIKGSGLVVQAPTETFSSARAALGTIITKNPTVAPLPDATEASALRAAAAAHAALAPNTGALRIAAEDLADDEAEHRRFRMKDFMSDLDVGWSVSDVMKLHMQQNVSFNAWEAAIERGDWFLVQMLSSDHQLWHICAALKDDRLLVRFSCPAGLGLSGNMDLCPTTTCAEALASH